MSNKQATNAAMQPQRKQRTASQQATAAKRRQRRKQVRVEKKQMGITGVLGDTVKGALWNLRNLHPCSDIYNAAATPVGIPDKNAGQVATADIRNDFTIPPPPGKPTEGATLLGQLWNCWLVTLPIFLRPVIAIGSWDQIEYDPEDVGRILSEVLDLIGTKPGIWVALKFGASKLYGLYIAPSTYTNSGGDVDLQTLATHWRHEYMGLTVVLNKTAFSEQGMVRAAQFASGYNGGTTQPVKEVNVDATTRKREKRKANVRGLVGRRHVDIVSRAHDVIQVSPGGVEYTLTAYVAAGTTEPTIQFYGLPNTAPATNNSATYGWTYESPPDTLVTTTKMVTGASTTQTGNYQYLAETDEMVYVQPTSAAGGVMTVQSVTGTAYMARSGVWTPVTTAGIEIDAVDETPLLFLRQGARVGFVPGEDVTQYDLTVNDLTPTTQAVTDQQRVKLLTQYFKTGTTAAATGDSFESYTVTSSDGVAFSQPVADNSAQNVIALSPPSFRSSIIVQTDPLYYKELASKGTYMPQRNFGGDFTFATVLNNRPIVFGRPDSPSSTVATVIPYLVNPTMGIGVQYWAALSEAASLECKLQIGYEQQVTESSPISGYVHAAPAQDPKALATNQELCSVMQHCFPSSYNSLGAILGAMEAAKPGVASAVQLLQGATSLGKNLVNKIRQIQAENYVQQRGIRYRRNQRGKGRKPYFLRMAEEDEPVD